MSSHGTRALHRRLRDGVIAGGACESVWVNYVIEVGVDEGEWPSAVPIWISERSMHDQTYVRSLREPTRPLCLRKVAVGVVAEEERVNVSGRDVSAFELVYLKQALTRLIHNAPLSTCNACGRVCVLITYRSI